jgi:hypothetical protein
VTLALALAVVLTLLIRQSIIDRRWAAKHQAQQERIRRRLQRT